MALVRGARLVVTMGEPYAARVRDRYPDAQVIAFNPSVSDPFGSSLAAYRATADDLASRMDWVLEKLRALDAAAADKRTQPNRE